MSSGDARLFVSTNKAQNAVFVLQSGRLWFYRSTAKVIAQSRNTSPRAEELELETLHRSSMALTQLWMNKYFDFLTPLCKGHNGPMISHEKKPRKPGTTKTVKYIKNWRTRNILDLHRSCDDPKNICEKFKGLCILERVKRFAHECLFGEKREPGRDLNKSERDSNGP